MLATSFENLIIYTPNLQMAADMSIQLSLYIYIYIHIYTYIYIHIHIYIYIYINRVFQKELYNFESIRTIVYLDMLQEFLIPQMDEDDQEGRIHFQQDGAPPHYLGEVRPFPRSWIGRAAPIAWPPRSPDLTPMDFSYGDSLKIKCSYHLCLHMALNSELELLPQLQK